ncbi:MAG: sigma-54-dependent transcriptional regulator [Gammaproteobacteria bacterium]
MTQDQHPIITSTEVPVQEKRVLIVEDEMVFAKAIRKRLNRTGYHSDIAGDLAAARKQFKDELPDLVLLDMRLPDGSGLDFLADIRNQSNSAVAVLVMSAYGEVEDAVLAMKLGASDYLKKPVDLDELMINVEKVFERDELSRKLNYSSKREQHANEPVEFLGDCSAIRTIRQQVERISQLTQTADSIPPTVLILGETGTGKDIIAHLLHIRSHRNSKPFVHVDCASLPKDLIEAELFGHEKGAFTSAHIARTGLIEAAEDGVLFMDEIGELPPDLQSKLLAVLERRTLRKVGTTQERPVAAWFIAATNRDIAGMSTQGEFRSDLYFRLNVLSIVIPPLHERGNDIILLARYFAGQTARRYGFSKVALTPESEKVIRDYPWPGNVRELEHMIERAVLLSGGGNLTPDTLALGIPSSHVQELTIEENMTLESAELTLIKLAMERAHGNVSKAARDLGITRMALRYRLKKYDL